MQFDDGTQDEYAEEDLDVPQPSPIDPVGDEPDDQPEPRQYAPYDPTVLHTPTEPVLTDPDGEVLPGFDARYRQDFDGLLFIGALTKSFTWLGHSFVIKTLAVDEMLAVSLLVKHYEGSIGQGLAYRTAVAALAVTSIDGRDLPMPVGPEEDPLTWAEQRFSFAKARWFQFTIDAIYNEYLELEGRTQRVVDAMGEAFGPTGSMTG